ncbi:MAG: hypothetical protein WAM30_10325 [Candidatus Dormiibacterota bacterium]
MGGKVSADSQSVTQAQQLQSYVSSELPAALNKLNTLANSLAGNQNFQGRYATQFRSTCVPDIKNSTSKMQSDLQQLSELAVHPPDRHRRVAL